MIKLYVGPMFSAKSHHLANHLTEDSVAFIPQLDTRSGNTITSRTGLSIPATSIRSDLEFSTNIFAKSNIIIDEIQFLDSSVINFIIRFKDYKNWILGGLGYDYMQIPFENTQRIMEVADTVVQLYARCEICGHDAIHTCRRNGVGQDRIVIGSDQYYPLCNDCLEKYGNNSL